MSKLSRTSFAEISPTVLSGRSARISVLLLILLESFAECAVESVIDYEVVYPERLVIKLRVGRSVFLDVTSA